MNDDINAYMDSLRKTVNLRLQHIAQFQNPLANNDLMLILYYRDKVKSLVQTNKETVVLANSLLQKCRSTVTTSIPASVDPVIPTFSDPNQQDSSSSSIESYPLRFYKYSDGDIWPDTLIGTDCGIAPKSLKAHTLQNATWSAQQIPLPQNVDFTQHYIGQIFTRPTKLIALTISNHGDWTGTQWPVSLENGFQILNCNASTNVWQLVNYGNVKIAQDPANLAYYFVVQSTIIDKPPTIGVGVWACAKKASQPSVGQKKKQASKVILSDQRTNVSLDSNIYTVYRCDDLKTGTWQKVATIDQSAILDLSVTDSQGSQVWSTLQSDPFSNRWIWACTSQSNGTCKIVAFFNHS
jgi:hypothetical protein